MKTEEIFEIIEELENRETKDFISSLDLTPEQMELLANHENGYVRGGLAKNPNLTEELMLKLSNDENEYVRWWLTYNPNLTEELMIKLTSDEDGWVNYDAFEKFRKLNSLKSEDLESAYDLINNSKYIGRKHFEETFDYIANKFPELSKLAKMFKTIILKGKKDLK